MGVISMKLVGEGTFNRENRKAAMRSALENAGVDCVIVGYQSATKIHDFNGTVLHLLGMNHERLTFKFQRLGQKLTGVVRAKIVPDLIA
jgi:hypothetical protein